MALSGALRHPQDRRDRLQLSQPAALAGGRVVQAASGGWTRSSTSTSEAPRPARRTGMAAAECWWWPSPTASSTCTRCPASAACTLSASPANASPLPPSTPPATGCASNSPEPPTSRPPCASSGAAVLPAPHRRPRQPGMRQGPRHYRRPGRSASGSLVLRLAASGAGLAAENGLEMGGSGGVSLGARLVGGADSGGAWVRQAGAAAGVGLARGDVRAEAAGALPRRRRRRLLARRCPAGQRR